MIGMDAYAGWRTAIRGYAGYSEVQGLGLRWSMVGSELFRQHGAQRAPLGLGFRV